MRAAGVGDGDGAEGINMNHNIALLASTIHPLCIPENKKEREGAFVLQHHLILSFHR